MDIAFRADAVARMGTGHLMRCLTLADELKKGGARTRFVSRGLSDFLHQELLKRGHEVCVLDPVSNPLDYAETPHSLWLGVPQSVDAEETVAVLSDRQWDWIVVDHYALDTRWESVLRSSTRHLMAIDDLADRHHDCDLLLDQNFRQSHEGRYLNLVPDHCTLMMGPFFALLQDEYSELHGNTKPRENVKRLLVFFGGADFDDLTGRALRAALDLGEYKFQIDVVLSLSSPNAAQLREFASVFGNVVCHGSLPTLAPLMAKTDLAIGAIGATSWERLCLGLPTIAITLADNQIPTASELHQAGLVKWLGNKEDVTEAMIGECIAQVCRSSNLSLWSEQCMAVCDGLGTSRIVHAMHAN